MTFFAGAASLGDGLGDGDVDAVLVAGVGRGARVDVVDVALRVEVDDLLGHRGADGEQRQEKTERERLPCACGHRRRSWWNLGA